MYGVCKVKCSDLLLVMLSLIYYFYNLLSIHTPHTPFSISIGELLLFLELHSKIYFVFLAEQKTGLCCVLCVRL
jgi:hypothetical protein